jgi:hypothetical protein
MSDIFVSTTVSAFIPKPNNIFSVRLFRVSNFVITLIECIPVKNTALRINIRE